MPAVDALATTERRAETAGADLIIIIVYLAAREERNVRVEDSSSSGRRELVASKPSLGKIASMISARSLHRMRAGRARQCNTSSLSSCESCTQSPGYAI